MKLLEQGNATMGVWLGKNVLGQVDEVRHDVTGSVMTYLSVVLPRGVTAAGYGVQPMINAGDGHVEIEPDYETAPNSE